MNTNKPSVLIAARPDDFDGIKKQLADFSTVTFIQTSPTAPLPLPEIARTRLSALPANFDLLITESSELVLEQENYPDSFFDEIPDTWVKNHTGYKATINTIVAYTFCGSEPEFLYSSLQGTIIAPPTLEPANHLSFVFQPEGHNRTLLQMKRFNFAVNGKHTLYLPIGKILRNRLYHGLFETHITVHLPSGPEHETKLQEFNYTCKETHCKPIFIQLEEGKHPEQLMTSSYCSGDFDSILTKAFELANHLAKKGFDITRLKVEAMFSNEGVPISDDDAVTLSPHNYFEFHIKLELPLQMEDPRTHLLKTICQTHNFHLSQNAFKTQPNQNTQHRFMTTRLYKIGRELAYTKLKDCTNALQSEGFTVLSKQREYSIFDTNVRLDKGWLQKD